MRRLFLSLHTPLKEIETAAECAFRDNDYYPVSMRYGLSETVSTPCVIILNVESYLINLNKLPDDITCIIMTDEITLDGIMGQFAKLDFDYIENGAVDKIQYTKDDLIRIIKSYNPSDDDYISFRTNDYARGMIEEIEASTSFISKLAAVTYAVGGDDARFALKKTFLEWIRKDQDSNNLRERICRIAKFKRNKKMEDLISAFESEKGKVSKQAVKHVIEATLRGEEIDFDELSERTKTGVYDMRYIANITPTMLLGKRK